MTSAIICKRRLPTPRSVIDFSQADGTAALAEVCAETGKILIIGTTGQDSESRQKVANCAQKVPIVFAPNFSVGVNTLFWLTRKAIEILGPEFDLEVVEMHHRLKKDAPSGTAKRLAEILAEVRGLSYEGDTRHGRTGMIGERTSSEIGLHAVRGGDVVGDHTVIYANVGERLELTHKASSRETFAKGALRAAQMGNIPTAWSIRYARCSWLEVTARNVEPAETLRCSRISSQCAPGLHLDQTSNRVSPISKLPVSKSIFSMPDRSLCFARRFTKHLPLIAPRVPLFS